MDLRDVFGYVFGQNLLVFVNVGTQLVKPGGAFLKGGNGCCDGEGVGLEISSVSKACHSLCLSLAFGTMAAAD